MIRACLALPSELLRSYPQGWLVRGTASLRRASLGPFSISVLRPSRRTDVAEIRPFNSLGLQSFFVNRACIAFTAGESNACLIISSSRAEGIANWRGIESNIACKRA